MAWCIAVSIAQENVHKYLLECTTEPCMIESGIYQQWQTTDKSMLNDSHCSYGRIHWQTKCIIEISAEQLYNGKTQACEKISKVLRWL